MRNSRTHDVAAVKVGSLELLRYGHSIGPPIMALGSRMASVRREHIGGVGERPWSQLSAVARACPLRRS